MTDNQEIAEKLAALLVRRRCNQHACSDGPECPHENHRRDVHLLKDQLQMLDLPLTYPQISDDERAQLLRDGV